MSNQGFLIRAVTLVTTLFAASASAAEEWAAPAFAPGWRSAPQEMRPVTAHRIGNVVTVSGLAVRNGGKWGLIGTLPQNMRPAQRLIFSLNTHDHTARVDVTRTGQIIFVVGNKAHNWVSLDGITFSVAKPTRLKLTQGWKNYGQQFAFAQASREGDRVTLAGLVKPGKGHVITTLPSHMRPKQRLVFNVNSHSDASRVDVFPNGQVLWIYRPESSVWVSLSGISFYRGTGKPLKLAQGWGQHPDSAFARANLHRDGNRVTLSGIAYGKGWGHIASLPSGSCPNGRLIFDASNHDRSARVDILKNCTVRWVGGGKKHGWINLDGLSFVLRDATAGQTQEPTPKGKPKAKPRGGGTALNTTSDAPSVKEATEALQEYPRFAKLNVEWRRSENHAEANARLEGYPVTAYAFKPPGKNQVIVAVAAERLKVNSLLSLKGTNALGSFELRDAIVFSVPFATGDVMNEISALPKPVAAVLKANKPEFNEAGATITLAPGLTYFSTLVPKGLIKRAFELMRIDTLVVDGAMDLDEYDKPVNTVTLSAKLSRDPLQTVLGPIKVIGVNRKAEPRLFITATGTSSLEVGYQSLFDVFGEPLAGKLSFGRSGSGGNAETSLTLEMSKDGEWKNPALMPQVRLRNLTLTDAVVTLERTIGGRTSETRLSLTARNTKIRHTNYSPSAFAFTVVGASALPKAVFVNLATTKLNLVQMAELADFAVQLTPRGQLSGQVNPYAAGSVYSALQLDKLPAQLIEIRNPKIYLATPGAVNPDNTVIPPLPAIAGAGAHVRGEMVAFGRRLAATESQVDFKGLHTETSFGALPFGAVHLKNARFKVNAVPGELPEAAFSGDAKMAIFKLGSSKIGVGKRGFQYNFESACIGLLKVRARGETDRFNPSIPSIKPTDCVADVAETIRNAANDVHNISKATYDKTTRETEEALKKISKKTADVAAFVGNSISKAFGKKKSRPKPPTRKELTDLKCSQGELKGYIFLEGKCQENLVADVTGLGWFKASATVAQSSAVVGPCYVPPPKRLAGNGGIVAQASRPGAPNCREPMQAGKAINQELFDRSQTKTESNPWWETDLRGRYHVHQIVVYAPAKDPNALDGAIVVLSDTVSGDALMTDTTKRVRRYRLGAGVMSVINPQVHFIPPDTSIPQLVRHIRIYKPGKGQLAIGEVQVLGANETKNCGRIGGCDAIMHKHGLM